MLKCISVCVISETQWNRDNTVYQRKVGNIEITDNVYTQANINSNKNYCFWFKNMFNEKNSFWNV